MSFVITVVPDPLKDNLILWFIGPDHHLSASWCQIRCSLSLNINTMRHYQKVQSTLTYPY